MVNSTSCAVTGEPSWNVSPGRSVMSTLVAPGSVVNDLAITPTSWSWEL